MRKQRYGSPSGLRVKLCSPQLDDLTAEAWYYPAKKSQEVYVQLLQHQKHIVTLICRIPLPTPTVPNGE